MPYLYTRVRCCETDAARLDPKYDEIILSGANGSIETAVAGCDVPVYGPESPEWSHSPSCVNFPFVRNDAQEVRGVYGPLTTVLKVAILPMAGCGRRLFRAICTLKTINLPRQARDKT